MSERSVLDELGDVSLQLKQLNLIGEGQIAKIQELVGQVRTVWQNPARSPAEYSKIADEDTLTGILELWRDTAESYLDHQGERSPISLAVFRVHMAMREAIAESATNAPDLSVGLSEWHELTKAISLNAELLLAKADPKVH